MPKKQIALAKLSLVHPNSLTTIKATGSTVHAQTKHQRNTTKVVHGRLFGGKATAWQGNRMILNLKNLNKYANKLHFKMDTLNTIIKLVEKDCYMVSIDLKDACYSVPIATSDRKY